MKPPWLFLNKFGYSLLKTDVHFLEMAAAFSVFDKWPAFRTGDAEYRLWNHVLEVKGIFFCINKQIYSFRVQKLQAFSINNCIQTKS